MIVADAKEIINRRIETKIASNQIGDSIIVIDAKETIRRRIKTRAKARWWLAQNWIVDSISSSVLKGFSTIEERREPRRPGGTLGIQLLATRTLMPWSPWRLMTRSSNELDRRDPSRGGLLRIKSLIPGSSLTPKWGPRTKKREESRVQAGGSLEIESSAARTLILWSSSRPMTQSSTVVDKLDPSPGGWLRTPKTWWRRAARRGPTNPRGFVLLFESLINGNGCMKKTRIQEDFKNLIGYNGDIISLDSGLNQVQSSRRGHPSCFLEKLGKKEWLVDGNFSLHNPKLDKNRKFAWRDIVEGLIVKTTIKVLFVLLIELTNGVHVIPNDLQDSSNKMRPEAGTYKAFAKARRILQAPDKLDVRSWIMPLVKSSPLRTSYAQSSAPSACMASHSQAISANRLTLSSKSTPASNRRSTFCCFCHNSNRSVSALNSVAKVLSSSCWTNNILIFGGMLGTAR